MTARRIPVIDFADAFSPELARREALAWRSTRSRATWVLLLVNHGVAPALVEGQFDWARRFFALPQASKSAIDMRRSPPATDTSAWVPRPSMKDRPPT
jgi:isopenicillin N synthase-like dioxygenase